jgi:hypothetical protein
MKEEEVIAMLANSCMGCHILEKKTAATRIGNNILAVAMRLERTGYFLCNGFCMEICGTGDAFFQIRKETRPIQGIHALDAR